MLTYTYTYTGVPVGTTEFTLVLWIFNLYYRVYSGISDLIRVLQNLYMYFRFYMYITELILVLRNLYFIQDLFFCEGTRRYDDSEQIRIIAHTRSDQTYTDTDIRLS